MMIFTLRKKKQKTDFNNLRMQSTKKKKFKSLIDIGIGNGEFLEYLSFKLPNKNYIGTDTKSY